LPRHQGESYKDRTEREAQEAAAAAQRAIDEERQARAAAEISGRYRGDTGEI
jgi:hypothetical protein